MANQSEGVFWCQGRPARDFGSGSEVRIDDFKYIISQFLLIIMIWFDVRFFWNQIAKSYRDVIREACCCAINASSTGRQAPRRGAIYAEGDDRTSRERA
jgi:hypothetical protein